MRISFIFEAMRKLLWPFSFLYGLAVAVRNLAFSGGWLKQVSFPVPVIVVGNLSSGGTGKSPLVMWMASFLSREYTVSILSRGYGRSTKGFRWVTAGDTSRQAGDEPLQYATMQEQVKVAVCESRVEGIRRLMEENPAPEVILLDDAFQHRYVKPGFSILLSEYAKPYYSDALLPSGNLREPAGEAARADVILITKCPPALSAEERESIIRKIKPRSHQSVYFSYIHYRDPLFSPFSSPVFWQDLSGSRVLLLCGIANPHPLVEFIGGISGEVLPSVFADHHPYSVGDIIKLKADFNSFAKASPQKAFVITTRKDYMRLLNPELQHLLVDLPLLVVDIEPRFFETGGCTLEQRVKGYIQSFSSH